MYMQYYYSRATSTRGGDMHTQQLLSCNCELVYSEFPQVGEKNTFWALRARGDVAWEQRLYERRRVALDLRERAQVLRNEDLRWRSGRRR